VTVCPCTQVLLIVAIRKSCDAPQGDSGNDMSMVVTPAKSSGFTPTGCPQNVVYVRSTTLIRFRVLSHPFANTWQHDGTDTYT
jgi:hypothetical protein